MPKIKLKASLNGADIDHQYDGKGILTSNQFTYMDHGVKVIVSWSKDQICLKRIHKTYEILFIFEEQKKTKGYYHLMEHHMKMDLNIDTKKMLRQGETIHITYDVDMNEEPLGEYRYEVKYEVIE